MRIPASFNDSSTKALAQFYMTSVTETGIAPEMLTSAQQAVGNPRDS